MADMGVKIAAAPAGRRLEGDDERDRLVVCNDRLGDDGVAADEEGGMGKVGEEEGLVDGLLKSDWKGLQGVEEYPLGVEEL